MKELWKPVRSGENYEVSNLGQVRNSNTGRLVKPFVDRDQTYDRVQLCNNGRSRKVMVHTLVAEAFIGLKPDGMEIDHLNTNIHDNRACNLKYVTQEENRRNPLTIFNRSTAAIRKAILSGKSQKEILRRIDNLKTLMYGNRI